MNHSFVKEVLMILGVVIALLLFFEGARRTYRSIIWIFQWRQSQDWLSTQGTIIRSNLRNGRTYIRGRRSITAYTPDVVYEYHTNAGVFQSRRIFIGQQFPSSFGFSNEFVEKYPVGKKVTVYYNPEKPEVATLERDRRRELLLYLIGSLIYILLGFMVLGQGLRE